MICAWGTIELELGFRGSVVVDTCVEVFFELGFDNGVGFLFNRETIGYFYTTSFGPFDTIPSLGFGVGIIATYPFAS